MKKTNDLFSLSFVFLLIIQSLNTLSFYLTNPIFTEYLMERGVALEYTGYISSAISWVSMVATPFAGYASDRMNRKKMLIVSYSVTAFCLFAYVLAKDYSMILLVRVLHGLAFSVTSTLSITFATSFVPMESISQAIATLSIGSMFTQMLAPQFGSMIADSLGIDIVFYFGCFISAVAAALIIPLAYKETVKEKRVFNIKDLIAKEVLIYMVLISIFSFGNGIISYYLRMLGHERGINNISVFFTVYSFSLIIFKPLVSRIHDLKGIQYVLYPAFLINAAAMLMIGKAKALPIIIAAALLKALSQGCATSAMQVESVKCVEKERSGVGVSTCMIGQNIGNSLGPIIGGKIIASYGFEHTFAVVSYMLLLGFGIFYLYRKINENREVIV